MSEPGRAPNDDPRAYAWAMGAILLWATLAAATGDALEAVPPATLVLWSFAFAAATLLVIDGLAAARRRARGERLPWLPPPPALVALGLWGVLGYHVLFFEALHRAPPVEANLLNYLWPLLMVLLAPLIAKERLTRSMVLGALVGFGGAALVVTEGRWRAPAPGAALGYALAALAALAWATFSLGLRRLGAAGDGRMTTFVVASLVGAVPLALATDGLAPPRGRALAVVAWMGIGPMALGFHCWGRALATGSAARIGALSYLDPLLSTLALAWWLERPIVAASWVGMALIVGGAAAPALLAWRARARSAEGR